MHPKHKKNFRTHASRRAVERYQTYLPPAIISDMEKMIQNNQNILDRKRCSASRSIVTFDYSDKTYRVIYSRRFKKIVTFLPKGD